ncbi:MAG: hypothetical protein IT287_09710 [Bdellovibrionaceae bacterium]|nr:hypothetical protein [Pseudobdellovibrionaceae bacterium]
MRIFTAVVASLFLLNCTGLNQKDGYTRFQEAAGSGQSCGKLLKKLPVQKNSQTWSQAQQQSVEYAYNECLLGYRDLATHAAAIEFVKTVFRELDVNFKEATEKGSVSLVGSLETKSDKETVMMVHATEMNNAQMVNQGGEKLNSLWGQSSTSSRALGVLQMMAMAYAIKKTPDERKYNLALAVTEQGQWKGIAADFKKINIVLNEGGHAFSKQNKNMFLIGSEQKGGAWLKIRHKAPTRLLSHLDNLLAVFMPHEPRDFSGPSKCQLLSMNTVDQKINVVPNKVEIALKCKGVPTVNLGQAFSHQNVSIEARAEGTIYKFTIEIAHPKENKYGQLSALQIAAQGLQKLSIIPFRDWSFEEPKFYGHQRTPASIGFVNKAKDVYPQQSDWGGLLWDLDGASEWSEVSSEITPDKKDGPEKLFRTTCSWTGFYADQEGAEALVDCRLARQASRAGVSEDQDAKDFIAAIKARAKDPSLNIEIVKGWNSISSESSHKFIGFAKDQIKKIYPSSETTTWMSPSGTVLYSDKSKIPTYGFNPILRDDILEVNDKNISQDQIFTANQIYSGAIARLLHY